MKLINKKKRKNKKEYTDEKEYNWKEKNKMYLKELERFFDKVENVSDETLRNNITNQMLRCDKVLTDIAEEMFTEYYKRGYQKAKLE